MPRPSFVTSDKDGGDDVSSNDGGVIVSSDDDLPPLKAQLRIIHQKRSDKGEVL